MAPGAFSSRSGSKPGGGGSTRPSSEHQELGKSPQLIPDIGSCHVSPQAILSFARSRQVEPRVTPWAGKRPLSHREIERYDAIRDSNATPVTLHCPLAARPLVLTRTNIPPAPGRLQTETASVQSLSQGRRCRCLSPLMVEAPHPQTPQPPARSMCRLPASRVEDDSHGWTPHEMRIMSSLFGTGAAWCKEVKLT